MNACCSVSLQVLTRATFFWKAVRYCLPWMGSRLVQPLTLICWENASTIPSNPIGCWITLQTDSMRTYLDLCIIKYFLNIISQGNDMPDKMQALFAEYPEVDLGALGFPSGNWQEEPLWSTIWRRQGLSRKEKMGRCVPTSSTLIELFLQIRPWTHWPLGVLYVGAIKAPVNNFAHLLILFRRKILLFG